MVVKKVRTLGLRLLMIGIVCLTAMGCKKDALSDPSANNIPDITDLEEIQSITETAGISLLFFHNVWSKNCYEIRPVVEELALKEEYQDLVFFAEIEFDTNEPINRFYGIRGFPTIIIIKNRLERHRFTGKSHSLEDIESRLLNLINE